MPRQFRIDRLGAAGMVIGLSLIAVLETRAGRQVSPPTDLGRQIQIKIENMKLPDILKQLHQRFSMQFAMDGTPKRETSTFTFDFQGSERELLDRVTDTFDYAWSPAKGGVILLTKRFKDPYERPQLILPELRQTAKDMLKVLPAVEPDAEHEKWGPVLIRLASSLTEAQNRILNGGGQLAYGDLAPVQQELLSQVILMRGYGPARGVWEDLLAQLESMDTAAIVGQVQAGVGEQNLIVSLVEKGRRGTKLETRLGRIGREGQEQ
jgi:hypothetical protein